MTNILWLTNIPSPYRVDFFNELGKHCNLTVLFERGDSTERDESWKCFCAKNFEAIKLKGKKFGVAEAFCFSVRKYLKKGLYDHIVVTNYASPTGMLAVHHMKKKGIPYVIEGDGAFVGSGRGLKERLKKYLLSGAESYFSTAKEHDKYYLSYGATQDKLYRYPFTSLFEKDILPKLPTKEEKNYLKEELGIKNKKMLLAVGQFIPRKGFDVLLRAMKELPKDVGVYFIGGEPTAEYINLKQEFGLENVNFVGFKNKEELKKYYMAADVFVLPTREDIWGLVINEAMANGLPIISTDRCIAALELVEDGVNGYVVPVDDVQALSEKIKRITSDESLSCKMGEMSLRKIQEYTIEEMAKRHTEIFKACKK